MTPPRKQSPAGPRGAAERRTVGAEFAMREEEHRDGRQNQDRWLHAGPTAATCTLSVESAGKGHTGVLDEGRARYAPGATNCFSVDCTRTTAGSATPPGPTRVRVPKDPLQATVVRACSRSGWARCASSPAIRVLPHSTTTSGSVAQSRQMGVPLSTRRTRLIATLFHELRKRDTRDGRSGPFAQASVR
jgi:hypothetical protein